MNLKVYFFIIKQNLVVSTDCILSSFAEYCHLFSTILEIFPTNYYKLITKNKVVILVKLFINLKLFQDCKRNVKFR